MDSYEEKDYGSEVLQEILDMLKTNFSLLVFDTFLNLGNVARANYDKTRTFFLRLNRLGQKSGRGRELALDALVQCTNDLDCIFEIVRLGAPGLFLGGLWRN